MRLISYCLYGSRPMYVRGMVENARLAPEIYPGWKVRVYVEDGADTAELEALGCEIRRMGKAVGHAGMGWRLAPAWEPGVERVIFRDADSRLNVREAAAVEDWIDSGLAAHAMHDHAYHAGHAMMGGVWGVLGDVLPAELKPRLESIYAGHMAKGDDSRLLDREIFPLVRGSLLTHSSVPVLAKLEWPARPFPEHPEWQGFVGQQVGDDGVPIWPGAKAAPHSDAPVADADGMLDYWEQVHRRGGLAEVRAALTGAHLADHVDALKAAELVIPGKSILCIGVGLGGWVWELAQLGCKVSALDIAPAAVAKVAGFAKGYLPGQELPAGGFDLALSHWVTPHMPPAALAAQVKQVVPALKSGGVFALHFNEPLGWKDGQDPRAKGWGEARRFKYARSLFTRAAIEDMVHGAGGKVLRYAYEVAAPTHSMTVCVAHIGRKP